MMHTKLAVRSLLMRWKQYFSLFLVSAFGAAISLFLFFTMNGMLHALNMKVKTYYGGDYQFLNSLSAKTTWDDPAPYIEQLKAVFPPDVTITSRIDFDYIDAFYFEGTGMRQRLLKAVDFATEQDLFSRLNYIEGNADGMAGSSGIILSELIATTLGCSVGDTVTMMGTTYHGYTTTVPLTVQAVFRDSSVFGVYISYIDMDYFRKQLGYPKTHANRICVFFPDKEPTEKDTRRFQAMLSEQFNMFPLVKDKYEFYDARDKGRLTELTYALFPLSSHMQELNIVIEALHIVTFLVSAILIAIIVIGISSTYKVIIMKRVNEIGIYKAIGMKRGSVYALIASETLVLLATGCAVGTVLSTLLCAFIRLFNFSFIPNFDLFLINSAVVPIFSFGTAVLLSLLIIVTTLAAVLFSVREAVRKMPSEALATTA